MARTLFNFIHPLPGPELLLVPVQHIRTRPVSAADVAEIQAIGGNTKDAQRSRESVSEDHWILLQAKGQIVVQYKVEIVEEINEFLYQIFCNPCTTPANCFRARGEKGETANSLRSHMWVIFILGSSLGPISILSCRRSPTSLLYVCTSIWKKNCTTKARRSLYQLENILPKKDISLGSHKSWRVIIPVRNGQQNRLHRPEPVCENLRKWIRFEFPFAKPDLIVRWIISGCLW